MWASCQTQRTMYFQRERRAHSGARPGDSSMQNKPASLFLFLLVSSATATAAAQETAAEEAPPQPNRITLVSQAPTTTQRTYHRHDGFYLRGSVGVGRTLGGMEADSDNASQSVDFKGAGLGIDLMAGYSPMPGFAVGGGVMSDLAFGADLSKDGSGGAADTTSLLAGAFIDGFPNANGPWHLGGMVGLAVLSLPSANLVDTGYGIGGSVFAGYDAWVSSDVALGGLLRFTLARTSGSQDDWDATSGHGALTLAFTALYH